jgi:hypothetical protein
MALQRPLKEGSVRTYQEKVGLGLTDILASEADADFDTIYGAWNGALGGDLTGALPNPELAAGVVRGTPSAGGATREIAKASIWGGDDLINASVTLAKLAAGAAIRQVIVQTVPSNFATNASTSTDFLTLSITTAGGLVVLLATGAWYGNYTADGLLHRFTLAVGRDQTAPGFWAIDCDITMAVVAGGLALRTPLPTFVVVDQPAPGPHVYHFSALSTDTAAYFVTATNNPGRIWALELA